jgi:tetratricopeptide (TPR) repeat protein
MRPNIILLTLAGLVIGFLLGFLLANSINRSEINSLHDQLESSRAAVQTAAADDQNKDASLTPEEIRDKIAEADKNPTNADYQKNLGLALYKYGAMKNDADIISEAARLLDRAANLLPNDQEVVVGAGNAWFDAGYIKKDNVSLEKARAAYERSLAKNPKDADVATDVAMTYYLETPPDDTKAVDSFKHALTIDPRNEKALEFLIQALVRQGNKQDAQTYLNQLRETHPSNQSIAGLSAQIEQQNTDQPK